jgi:glycosyltransferase involved in cell wall biosynthesis
LAILAFAYACEPDKGSEPGVGWMWVRLLARLDETWVITRENNADSIQRALSSIPEAQSLHFEYVDLPTWARFWKQGQRGVRLYYMMWQVAALRRARRLMKECDYTVAWHLTIANMWLGSLASLTGVPFIYGPVGGGVGMPWRFLTTLGLRGICFDAVRAAFRVSMRYLNPIARVSWRRARLILVQNRETRDWLPSRYQDRAIVIPNAIVDGVRHAEHRPGKDVRTALFAGRLVPLKGCVLAVQTLALTSGWRLVVCGSGPEEGRMRRRAVRLGVADRIEFRGWVNRNEVLRIMQEEADVLLFPSFHDEAGLAVAEATAVGLPSVCLDLGGPPLLGGNAVAPMSPRPTARALADALGSTAEAGSHGEVPTIDSRERVVRGALGERGLLEPATTKTPAGTRQ